MTAGFCFSARLILKARGKIECMKLITLFLTCADQEEAQKIADEIIDKKLAACVRLTDVNSTYWWNGKKENSQEVMLIMESIESKFEEIETMVRGLHSYDTFVLTGYQIAKASAGVQDWVEKELRV